MQIKSFDGTLKFSNDGPLSLFFTGTGSAFSKKYYQTSFLIIKGHDHLLVDCGTLFCLALENHYKTSIMYVDNILVTHPHADHIGSLEELALTGRYVFHKKLNMVITDGFKKKLWNESLKGGMHYSEDGYLYFDDFFNQIKPERIRRSPFSMYETNVGSINIKLFRTAHVTTHDGSLRKSQMSYGVLIDDRILFTGDIQFSPRQLEWLLAHYPIEHIFHDCDIGGYTEAVHASYRQLKTLPAEIKAKTFLCHYSSGAENLKPENEGFAGFAQQGCYYIF